MKKISLFLFLFSMGLLCSFEAIASGGFTPTYTTPTLELKPISSIDNSYQTASVCFLGIGDCQQGDYAKGDDDMNVDSAKQCQNEGYIHTAKNCLLPSFLDKPCGYNDAYFAECNKNIPRACTELGFKQVANCASGQKLKATPRCEWDQSYGICCAGSCPNNSSLTCTGTSSDDDGCGYTCKQCCSDACPSGQGLNYSGSNGSKTECGNQCKSCNTICPSGSSTSYSGSYAGSNECGSTCRSCSSSCPGGSSEYRTGSGSCGGSTTRDECGNKTCFYPYETCPCYPSCSSDWNCSCGSYTVGDGCGGSCTKCNACCSETCSGQASPCSSSQTQTSSCSLKCSSGTRYTCQAKPACSETCSGQASPCSSSQTQTSSCSLKCGSGTRYTCKDKPACSETCSGQSSACSSSQTQTSSCSLKCGSGTRYTCQTKPTCVPSKSETGCTYGTSSCSDGCGGTRTCCKSNPCTGNSIWYNGSCCYPNVDDPYWIDDCNCTYCSAFANVNNGCGGTRKSCRRQTIIPGCLCY